MSQAIELLPEVKDFLSRDTHQMLVGSEWRDAANGETFETLDPGNGKSLGRVAAAGPTDVESAVAASQNAFETSGWAEMPLNDRAVILHRFADLVDKHHEAMAQIESLDVGKPIEQARGDVPVVSSSLRYFSDLMVRTRLRDPIAVSGFDAYSLRVPYGPCGFIFPWNFPILLVGWNISPALAAGNTVVIKPAEDTPLTTIYLAGLAHEAGVPDGVINILPGMGETAGAALSRHAGIKRMSFTGSPEVGKMVGEACGRNLVPVKLELGGKGAAVCFEDVDIPSTVEGLTGAVTLNTGQVCCTATRWMVHEKIWDDFIAQAIERLKGKRIGYGMNSDTEMGPVVNQTQQNRVLGYLEKGVNEGASLLLEGGRASVSGCEGGYFVKPALLTGAMENVAAREEIFGPVAYLMKFKAEGEAIEMVNSSPYGLANSIWSADSERANRVAEKLVSGNSWINAHNLFAAGIPYAGCNLSGMGGGVNCPEMLMDYFRHQSIVRPLQ